MILLLKAEVIVQNGFPCVKIVGIVCYFFLISLSSFNLRIVSQKHNVHVHHVLSL